MYFGKENSKKERLPFEYVRRINETQINVNIIEASSPLKVKYDVFRRINTGGKHLNNQEIRNSLADKHTSDLINELAKSRQFKTATTNSVTTIRMDAQELVLRFIGFYYLEILKDLNLLNNETLEYKGNMRAFLDACVGKLNLDNGKYHKKIKEAFYDAMENATYLFGKYAFRKTLPKDLDVDARRPLINKSLFTTWSVELSKFKPEIIKNHNENGCFSQYLAQRLESNSNFWAVVSYTTNDKNALEEAFKTTRDLIKLHLNLN